MEAVIAMVIMVLVFGIAMMIFTNVTRLSLSVRKVRAQAVLQDLLLQAAKDPGNSDRTIPVEDLRIEQKVTPFGQGPGLSQIELTAYDESGKPLAEVQQIIRNENEDR